MNLLDTDEYLLEVIFEHFHHAQSHQWEIDGSLELLDANNVPIVRLSRDQVDHYINELITDESKDNDEDLQDYFIEDDAF